MIQFDGLKPPKITWDMFLLTFFHAKKSLRSIASKLSFIHHDPYWLVLPSPVRRGNRIRIHPCRKIHCETSKVKKTQCFLLLTESTLVKKGRFTLFYHLHKLLVFGWEVFIQIHDKMCVFGALIWSTLKLDLQIDKSNMQTFRRLKCITLIWRTVTWNRSKTNLECLILLIFFDFFCVSLFLSFFLSFFLSLFVCLFPCLFVCLFVCFFVSLFLCFFVSLLV